MRVRLLSAIFFCLLGVGLVGCAGSVPPVASASVVDALATGQGDFARALTAQPFDFPHDHGPHPEYRTEWWYYTGNLRDERGAEYGFQLTFFRSALTSEMPARSSALATNQLYMAHFALTSAPADEHVSFERFSRGAGGLADATGDPAFSVWLDDWRVEQTGPTTYALAAATTSEEGEFRLALTLEETRAPVLHGDAGLSQKGPEPGNANYYYSLVQLSSTGELTFAGTTVAVTGRSWMDHEYGTSTLSGETRGWDWFAVQLDHGVVFMFGEFHNGLGSARSVYAGTLAYPDGRQYKLEAAEFELTALDTWRSPTTGINYPASWRVSFPEHAIELTIRPLIADQEMAVSFVYYEGATVVTGTQEGEAVEGRGYVELTGYSDVVGGYQR